MRHNRTRSKLIVLASASERRRQLLEQIIPRFMVIFPQVAEIAPDSINLKPAAYVQHLARLKAEAIAQRIEPEPALVIGADTIVYAQGKIIGKPENHKDAQRIMERLSGTTHSVITGVCVIDTATARNISGYEETIVRMKELSPGEIRKIINTGRHLDKAGGYAIQESGDKYIEVVEGHLDNAVGLPLRLVRRLIRKLSS